MKVKWAAASLWIMIIMGFLIFPISEGPLSQVLSVSKADTIVIDPGHGGMDGGAVGSSGNSEKDINLAIGLAIKELAEADGWNVVMTRKEDKGLYTGVKNDGTDQMEIQGKRSIRSLKTEDLKERKRIIEETKPVMAVSIHLNSFKEDPGVHGAQTFYPSKSGDETVVEKSKELAEKIQDQLIQGLKDGTNRTALGKKDVMLFKNPVVPVVIVECGFLSNKQEEKQLCEKNYQKKIAECIYEGIMEFSGKKRRKPLKIIDNRGGVTAVRKGYDFYSQACG